MLFHAALSVVCRLICKYKCLKISDVVICAPFAMLRTKHALNTISDVIKCCSLFVMFKKRRYDYINFFMEFFSASNDIES